MARPDASFLAPAFSTISSSNYSPHQSPLARSESSSILALNRSSNLNPSGPSDRKRPRLSSSVSSNKQNSQRRPRPPPLSSKSSSLIPTVCIEPAPADPWSTRTLTMSSPSSSNLPQQSPAADLLRQAMMQK
ncbi:hypothetical protein AUEXF2481DRAFT_37867 [Aureobasidium subglaciale EXF-2481]|uniref:Uncharacterized protein n=1 Tax=Aureobasidium subglaciale (strain EXF-2481) TaxID=1043005 RepID=A0A074YMM4_AURSE|nr:uncharacterized protein AUEXF2481DRAFT_37867 [Aureobasidium subglaciale EXF-2481]KEQ97344.1 hypothetical protein AUEXF2481DRAFT_37867 [Aureobasidium subglaciale EXF-2481]